MNEKQALAKLKKLIKSPLAWRINEKAATAEEREEAKAQHDALRKAHKEAVAARDARSKALLAGDAEYRRLVAEAKAARDAIERNGSTLRSRRITVGYTSNMAGFSVFHVVAEGDNWEDVVAEVERKGGKP